jgi:hypothetical protein
MSTAAGSAETQPSSGRVRARSGAQAVAAQESASRTSGAMRVAMAGDGTPRV